LTSTYSVFGLRLRSNLAIPGLVPTESSSADVPDVALRLGISPYASSDLSPGREEAAFVSAYLDESGKPVLRIWKKEDGSFLRLEYSDGVQFWLARNAKDVWAHWPDSSSLEDTATYLLGPVLGLLLRLRGVACLHASAVAFAESAVAFVGSEGAGKSTTAAALARRGHAVISDDIVALEDRAGRYFVLPAYPYLSLWPESVEMVYGPGKTLPNFSQNWDKRQLLLAENRLRFAEQALPLRAIFLLGERTAGPSAPFLEKLPPKDGLLSLIVDSYATGLLDKDMRAREFELLGRLLATVPVWRVRPHADASRIDPLCDLISQTCNDL
jgi:hypothetical protein